MDFAFFSYFDCRHFHIGTKGWVKKGTKKYYDCTSNLQQIPSVGASIAKGLLDIGVESVEELIGRLGCAPKYYLLFK